MRTCRKCFEYAYVFVGGDVRICPWNGIVIGNLLENTLEEIWNGKKVDEIRKAFSRGELLGCNEQYCPDCINEKDTLQIEPEEMQRLYDNPTDIPAMVSLAYDERCNHTCPSCRSCVFVADKDYRDKLDRITENIEPYLMKVKHIATNGIGDLFVSTEIVDMLSRLHPEKDDFSMFIETNGVLFKDNWHKIEHLSKFPITVSVTPNSFDRETYRYLAGRDDLEKFEESMQFISDMKHEGKISRIRLIMVIQDSNFRQIPDFIKRGIEYDADDIVLRPIYKWFGLQEDELLYKNILNPCHPYYKEYLEIIEDPICKDPRVLNWGFDVDQEPEEFPTLAMKRQILGENEAADKIRKVVCDIKPVLKEYERQGKKTVIYGIGRVGKAAFESLSCGDDTIDMMGFLVKDKCGNPDYWMGYEVQELSDFSYPTDDVVVLVALTKRNQMGVREALQSVGFDTIIMIDERSEHELEV